MGVSVRERDLIHFLARRGYAVVDPGDVSMCLPTLPHREPPPAPDLAALGLALWPFDNQAPFTGQETPGREMYTLWGDNGGDAYAGLALVDGAGVLHGHISWYPMVRPGWAAIANFWLSPVLRGRGLGRYLLDLALYEMAHAAPPHGGYHAVEVQTQTVRHPVAVELYQRRGFSVDEAWVNLVKT
jgi:GNAT superfamily N-acetyltransferase